jgi:hypothetical protein
MAHEKNVTKSYIVDGEEIFYNTPDPKLDVPDMSLPSEYGKQYRSVDIKAEKGAKDTISKKLDKSKKDLEIGSKMKKRFFKDILNIIKVFTIF